MKIAIQLFLVTVAAVVGIFLWTIIFPSPQHVIRARLNEMARDASFTDGQSSLSGYLAAQTIGAFFSTNVQVVLNDPGTMVDTLNGRDQIIQTMIGIHQSVNNFKVDFPDINVTVAPDKNSATADLTIRAQVGGKDDSIAEEMKLTFEKIDGQWLITHVETVPVFT
jgi:ketosteroid isomerase-like protein